MLIYVHEYMTACFAPGQGEEGLEREGAAMLRALVADLASLRGTTVVPLVHEARVVPGLAAEPLLVGANESIVELLHRLYPRGAWLVVAPEMDGILANITRELARAGRTVLHPSGEIVDVATDKLRLAQMLAGWSPLTFDESRLAADRAPWHDDSLVVIKPRDGCGTLHVGRSSWNDRWGLLGAIRDRGYRGPLVGQQNIAGEALSVAVIGRGPGDCTVLPVARQFINEEHQSRVTWLHYSGGEIAPRPDIQPRIERAVRSVLERLPSFRGYIGVDLVLDANGRVWVIEINPRLTTSYVGYSRWLREASGRADAMARLMLGEAIELPSLTREYRYYPDGSFEE